VAYDNNEKKLESVYSIRVKAGKRRTYFFDVRETRGSDFYLTITESRKRFDSDGYDRHKIFLYKEDFNKFLKGLNETVEHVKTVLMPDFDFDAFNHEFDPENPPQYPNTYPAASEPIVEAMHHSVLPEMPAPASTPENPVSTPELIEPTIAPETSGDNLSEEEVDKW
jgi:hypothetical protein